MNIRIKKDGHSINFPVPTRLIFNKASVWLYLKLARKYSSRARKYISGDAEQKAEKWLARIPDQAIYGICQEIRRIKRRHGSWELVHVKTADGAEVQITL